jgi:hypothetical protein
LNEKFANDFWKTGHKRHISAEWKDEGDKAHEVPTSILFQLSINPSGSIQNFSISSWKTIPAQRPLPLKRTQS